MRTDGANAGLSASQESRGGFNQNIESSRGRLSAAKDARSDARAAFVEARNSGSKSERRAAFAELRQAKLEVQEARADLRTERGARPGTEVSSPDTGDGDLNQFNATNNDGGGLSPEQKLQLGIPIGAIDGRPLEPLKFPH